MELDREEIIQKMVRAMAIQQFLIEGFVVPDDAMLECKYRSFFGEDFNRLEALARAALKAFVRELPAPGCGALEKIVYLDCRYTRYLNMKEANELLLEKYQELLKQIKGLGNE